MCDVVACWPIYAGTLPWYAEAHVCNNLPDQHPRQLMRRPRRERKQVSYTYDAYDEQIRSALRGPARDERRSARFLDPRSDPASTRWGRRECALLDLA